MSDGMLPDANRQPQQGGLAIDPRVFAPMLGRFDQAMSGGEFLEVPGLGNPNDPNFRRSWGERLTYNAGRMYLAGLVCGGSYGLYEGVRDSAGQIRRLRINSVLNATSRHGPMLGNSAGVLGMMFSGLETLAGAVRGEDDILNPIGAATLTGVLFKMGSGPRAATVAGVVGGGAVAAMVFAGKQLGGAWKNML
ncbi:Tim17/Tim22/Tim23/Pmp24 family-domain-containing protein [Pavlovales sp. CCMP2436]|nr:Tim17/Tim22/Tim23/Pmp24 family-domain-containing protein [Pavlovales sp. CCMP2436]